MKTKSIALILCGIFITFQLVSAESKIPVTVTILNSDREGNVSLLIWPDISSVDDPEIVLDQVRDFSVTAVVFGLGYQDIPLELDFTPLISLYQSQQNLEERYNQKAQELMSANLSEDELRSAAERLVSEYQNEQSDLFDRMIAIRSEYTVSLPVAKKEFTGKTVRLQTKSKETGSQGTEIQDVSSLLSFTIKSESGNDINRALIIDVDALRSDTVYNNIAELPNIEANLIQRGIRFTNTTCIFPSITLASQASIVTGNYPDTMGITGNRWFEPKTQTPRKYSYDVWYDWDDFVIWSDGLANKDIFSGSEMIYEAANDEGLNTTVVYHHYYKKKNGVNVWVKPRPLDQLLIWAGRYHMVDYRSTYYAVWHLYWSTPKPDVLMVYLPGLDLKTHDKGVSAQKEYVTNYVDSNIGWLVSTLKLFDMYDDTVLILVSDHGQYDASDGITRDELEDAVRDAGYEIDYDNCKTPPFYNACQDYDESDAVVAPNGGMAQIYVRDNIIGVTSRSTVTWRIC